MLESTWKELTRLSEFITTVPPGTEDYDRVLREIRDLLLIQNLVSPDYRGTHESKIEKVLNNPAIIGVLGNLAVAVLILNYEKVGIVTSRAFAFIRPK